MPQGDERHTDRFLLLQAETDPDRLGREECAGGRIPFSGKNLDNKVDYITKIAISISKFINFTKL